MKLPCGLTIAPLASFVPQAWRNGGGTTRTLAEAADGDWRISVAEVARDGPYSRFPGMQRMSLVIRGGVVELRSGADVVMLEPGEPAAYDGAAEWQATLRGEPVVALNTMTLRGRYRASIACVRDATHVPAGMFALVLWLDGQGTWRVPGAQTSSHAGAAVDADTVLLRHPDGPPLQLTPPLARAARSAAAVVLIEPLPSPIPELEGTLR
jgi:uncharacterized protein